MGVKCEAKDNQRIAAFKTAPGCPKPECLGKGKFKIVDAWKKKSNNALYQYDYGFSALVTLPSTAFDKSGGSILLRFANGNRQGNIQTWNFKYFGFYNNNNDILLHTKECVQSFFYFHYTQNQNHFRENTKFFGPMIGSNIGYGRLERLKEMEHRSCRSNITFDHS